MSNPKATALIKRLQKLSKDVVKSGILNETISIEQEFLIDKFISQIGRDTRGIKAETPVLRLDRLKIFAAHIKVGKLLQKFEMGYNGITAELPLLFPQHWAGGLMEDDRQIGLYLDLDCSIYEAVKFFFGLTEKQFWHLFYYYNQNPEWGNIRMTGRTGKARFAENTEQFIEYFENGGRQDA